MSTAAAAPPAKKVYSTHKVEKAQFIVDAVLVSATCHIQKWCNLTEMPLRSGIWTVNSRP